MKDNIENEARPREIAQESTTISETWLKREGAADVLDTIANLSNDEVFTPPRLARQVLDLLPQHVWSDKSLKFLDPCAKSGVFLREITKRLMVGLRHEIPDEVERREHILRNQVYGIAITQLTALMSRRTLYCSSDATREMNEEFPENCFSAVKFDHPDGNIKFPKVDHDWDRMTVDGSPTPNAKCLVCGASARDFGGKNREGMESHAYPFTHMNIQQIFEEDMKFDVVVGNPPYQISDGGHGASASPIYQKFVEKAEALSPQYLSMIIPSKWYSGGKGLNDFRDRMMSNKSIKYLVDYLDSKACFPGVDVAGGVCFFLIDRNWNGSCSIENKRGEINYSDDRHLDEFHVIIRDGITAGIIRKITSSSGFFPMSSVVSSRKPFGLPTSEKPKESGDLTMRWKGGDGPIPSSDVKAGFDIIDKWKVVSSYVSYDHAGQPGRDGTRRVLSKIDILPPQHICNETYLVLLSTDAEIDANSAVNYMKTRFFRFLLGAVANTQHINKDKFCFVPTMDLSETWTDEKLYAHFGLTQEEIDFIEATIKEMP